MIQAWLIDEEGFFIKCDLVENIEANMVEVGWDTALYKPQWNGEKWTEGATQEEIDEINKTDICPTKTVEERLEEAEQKLAESEEEKKLLKAQVEALNATTDFHEELIAEMATILYA